MNGLIKSLFLAFAGLIIILAFNNCSPTTGGTSSNENPAPASPNPDTTSPNPSTPAPESVDPWKAPVGDPIQGATLSDGWTDLREVPAPIRLNGGWTDSAAISPNGLSLYYGYATFDVGQWFDSPSYNVFNPTGPKRAGMTGNNFKIFRADLTLNGWVENYHPINGDPNVNEASASPNAKEDAVVFARFNGAGIAQLYYSTLNNGSWSTPGLFPAPINSPNASCGNDNPFVVGTQADGYTLYFESNRGDTAGTGACRSDGKKRLYYITYNPNVGFSTLQLVPGLDGGTAGEDDSQISVSQDKLQVYFTRASNTVYGVFTADWNGSTYTNVRQIVQPTFGGPFTGKLKLVGEANVAVTNSGSLLYMVCGIGQSEVNRNTPIFRVCVARKPK